MVPKESEFNKSVADAKRDVFHDRPPWKGMVKLNKYSIFIIT